MLYRDWGYNTLCIRVVLQLEIRDMLLVCCTVIGYTTHSVMLLCFG